MAGVDAVARENGSAIAALPADGIAVYPANDAHAATWHAIAGERRRLCFATEGSAEVTADARWVSGEGGDHWRLSLRTPAGRADLRLHMAGMHNVHNALAATAAAIVVGTPLASIVAGLQAFEPVAGRSQTGRWQRGGRSVTLVDDCYNANPDSVRAAITMLAGLPGPRWLVLGDMGEVGDQGPAFHTEVGAFARQSGIEAVWTVGALSAAAAAAFGAGARQFASVEELVAALPQAPQCASALVKGSRFMRMERVMAALRAQSAGGAHA
jgi:UDP-N-acetylmuramoyl-tripeptide--D-alanyl-D-alanine ligase